MARRKKAKEYVQTIHDEIISFFKSEERIIQRASDVLTREEWESHFGCLVEEDLAEEIYKRVPHLKLILGAKVHKEPISDN
jgi:hypothetical protein